MFKNTSNFDGCLQALVAMLGTFMAGVLYTLVGCYINVLLWNYAVVSLFGLPEVTFWQMFCLMVLLRLLFPLKVSFNKQSKEK